jgi:hypothetical protein
MLRSLLLLTLLAAVTSCSPQESGPTTPYTNIVPTVSPYDTDVGPDGATITWQVTNDDGREYKIERRFESDPWKPLERKAAGEQDLLLVEDTTVQMGQTYSYRVLVGNSSYQGEVTVTIPAR